MCAKLINVWLAFGRDAILRMRAECTLKTKKDVRLIPTYRTQRLRQQSRKIREWNFISNDWNTRISGKNFRLFSFADNTRALCYIYMLVYYYHFYCIIIIIIVTTSALDNGDYFWKGGWVIKRHSVPFRTTCPLDRDLSPLTSIRLWQNLRNILASSPSVLANHSTTSNCACSSSELSVNLGVFTLPIICGLLNTNILNSNLHHSLNIHLTAPVRHQLTVQGSRSSIFWDVTQLRLVVSHSSFR